jgi:PAS domain S-box-containing protein
VTAAPFSAPAPLVSLYQGLLACNTAILRGSDRTAVFNSICSALVQPGGLTLSWIGMLDPGDSRVWPQAHCGAGWSPKEWLQSSAHANALADQGPVSAALRSNAAQWPPTPSTDPGKPGHAEAVIPLAINGRACGVLVLYSATQDFFSPTVRALLTQLGHDIGHALERLDEAGKNVLAEWALHESEARYNMLFSNNSLPMLVIDPTDGQIVDANQRALAFYGYSHAAITALHITDINVTPAPQVKAEMMSAVQENKTLFNFTHRLADVSLREVEVFTTPITFRGATCLISAIHDVTERHRLEAKLRNTQSLVQRFIDLLPGVAFVKDSALRLVMANQFLGNLLGVDPKSLVGKTVHELFPPDFAEFVTPLEREVLASHTARTVDQSFKGRHIETSIFIIENESGQPYLGGLSLDVTDRYHARERTDALLHLNGLGDHLGEAEFMQAGLEIAERLTHSSLGFLHLVNDDQQTCHAPDNPHCAFTCAGIWANALLSKQPEVINDYAGTAQPHGLVQGHATPHRLASVPVVEGGKVRLLMGVGNKATDYTDFDIETLQLLGNDLWRMARRTRAENALKLRVDELLVMNQKLSEIQLQLLQSEKMASIGQLAAGVAHEINNPIGFVKSNLGTLSAYVRHLLQIIQAYEVLEGSADSDIEAVAHVRALKRDLDYDFLVEDLTKLLAESADGVQRISHIVADLKNFSRSGETSMQWTDLHAGIESTINVVWNKLKYKVKMQREYGELPLVRCVGSQINQVVMNLLVNAEQAIATQGTITLRTGCTDAQVWIEVQDTGCGIAADKLERIFEPFYTSKPIGEGTGLGLSISFGIIQRHHGTITVESTPGVGSTFRITLPIDQGNSES